MKHSRPFCDFCKCEECQNGSDLDWCHAPTDKGLWICEICYEYDQCTVGIKRNPNGPCDNLLCEHRPRLIGPWSHQPLNGRTENNV